MSWHDIPAGLELGIPGDFVGLYHEQRYNENNLISCTCFGSTRDYPLADGRTLSVSDSYAADHVVDLAAYDLVQIYTSGAWHGGGVSGGFHTCVEVCSGHATYEASYTDVSVAIDGIATELRSLVDGTLRPFLHPFPSAHVTPDTDGVFMRPTALWWDGQDPTNDANRSVWRPSELIGVIGAVHINHTMAETAGYDVYLGCGVRPLNVIYGGPSTTPEEVEICFV